MTLRRALRPALVGVCALAVILTGAVQAPAALADPLSDAQAQLDELEAQRSAVEQDYIASQVRQQTAQAQQADLAGQITAQQAALDALKPSIAWIVTAQLQGGGVDLTTSFLLQDSPDKFLAQMSTMASVNTIIGETVARYVSEQNRLDDLSTSLAAALTTIQTEVAQQQQLVADAQSKLDAEQAVVDHLTAQQQSVLRARQQAAENPVPAPPAPPTPTGARLTAPDASSGAAVPASVAAGASAGSGGAPSGRAQTALAWALQQVGKHYQMGATGPDAFDCSGLTMMAFRQIGIALPRTAAAQASIGTPVSLSALQPGDLLFFYSPIHHVAIYVGNGQIVHASTPATGVKVSAIYNAVVAARRIA